jgi:hypothetical protein
MTAPFPHLARMQSAKIVTLCAHTVNGSAAALCLPPTVIPTTTRNGEAEEARFQGAMAVVRAATKVVSSYRSRKTFFGGV